MGEKVEYSMADAEATDGIWVRPAQLKYLTEELFTAILL
jgi:hypothetical protein